MKSRKKTSTLLLIALISFGLQSCEKEYVSELPTLTIQDMTFDVDGGIKEQVFTDHDLSNYAVTSSANDWCRAQIDVKQSRLLVNVDENGSYDTRTATLTIKDFKDGVSTRSLTVTQDNKKGIEIDETIYNVPMEGGKVSVVIKRNVDFQVEIPQAATSWISLVQNATTRGLEPKTLTFAVAKNYSGAAREAIINVVNEKEDLSVSFLIHQSFEAIFDYSPKSMEFDELGGTQDVDVTANFSLISYSTDYWLGVKQENIDETHFKYHLTAAKFDQKMEKRTAEFLMQNTSVGKSATVKITQYRTLYIKKSEMTVEVGSKIALVGDELLVNRNDIEVTFISSNPDIATVNNDGTIIGVSPGICNITVSSLDGLYKDYMYVNVETPYNWEDYVTAAWEYEYDATTGKVKAVNCTFTNNTKNVIYLNAYKLYNNDVKIAEGEPKKTLSSQQSYSLTSSKPIADPDKPYYIEWDFTYDTSDYKMIFDQDKKKTITKVTPVAESRKARSRR